ncbi:MAG: LacI family DNA-binding transcriptional regulator [Collinsella sp.]
MAQMRIKDIAAEAGVSPATVSRYLNNRPGQMTEETRARIAAVIERTGYRPRAAARNLRSSRTNLIGVILADIANPFSSAMLEGLSASAAARGCSLMTAISGNDPAKEAESLTRLIDAGVDGLVVNTCGGNDEAIAAADVCRCAARPRRCRRRCRSGDINNRELVAGLVDAWRRWQ